MNSLQKEFSSRMLQFKPDTIEHFVLHALVEAAKVSRHPQVLYGAVFQQLHLQHVRNIWDAHDLALATGMLRILLPDRIEEDSVHLTLERKVPNTPQASLYLDIRELEPGPFGKKGAKYLWPVNRVNRSVLIEFDETEINITMKEMYPSSTQSEE